MIKRLFDIAASSLGVLVLWPLAVLVALVVKCHDGGPVLFKQTRIGRYGRPFSIIKFRTMTYASPTSGPDITSSNDLRITQPGQFLRKWKIDELPQLVNVMMGEMSIVGPRPEVPKYVELYPDELRRKVLSVRPGVTDFASIFFRNENEILAQSNDPQETYIKVILPTKLQQQARYVDEQSFFTDLRLILLTLKTVLSNTAK